MTDKIKYIADLILSFFTLVPTNDNYRQFPLLLAVIVCAITLLVIGVLVSAGIMILINHLG